MWGKLNIKKCLAASLNPPLVPQVDSGGGRNGDILNTKVSKKGKRHFLKGRCFSGNRTIL